MTEIRRNKAELELAILRMTVLVFHIFSLTMNYYRHIILLLIIGKTGPKKQSSDLPVIYCRVSYH